MKSPELNNVLDKAKQQLIKLHEIGILHRDISEDNIAVSADDTDVKLIDFGMSKYIKDLGDIDVEYYQDLYYEGVSRAGESEATLDYVLRLEHAYLETLR